MKFFWAQVVSKHEVANCDCMTEMYNRTYSVPSNDNCNVNESTMFTMKFLETIFNNIV